jgi:uncharacterized protein YfdQ (DUF2303 family)
MSTPTDLQAVIDTAIATTDAVEVTPGKIYVFRTPGGIETVDLYNSHRTTPERKTGTTTVRDSASFTTLWGKHSDADSEIYADAEALTITAVLNASGGEEHEARYGDHRLVLGLRKTQAWREWADRSGQFMKQEQFAEFLEEHLPDLQDPTGAEMLEIAQSIRGTRRSITPRTSRSAPARSAP